MGNDTCITSPGSWVRRCLKCDHHFVCKNCQKFVFNFSALNFSSTKKKPQGDEYFRCADDLLDATDTKKSYDLAQQKKNELNDDKIWVKVCSTVVCDSPLKDPLDLIYAYDMPPMLFTLHKFMCVLALIFQLYFQFIVETNDDDVVEVMHGVLFRWLSHRLIACERVSSVWAWQRQNQY